jgi:hypothetical protein
VAVSTSTGPLPDQRRFLRHTSLRHEHHTANGLMCQRPLVESEVQRAQSTCCRHTYRAARPQQPKAASDRRQPCCCPPSQGLSSVPHELHCRMRRQVTCGGRRHRPPQGSIVRPTLPQVKSFPIDSSTRARAPQGPWQVATTFDVRWQRAIACRPWSFLGPVQLLPILTDAQARLSRLALSTTSCTFSHMNFVDPGLRHKTIVTVLASAPQPWAPSMAADAYDNVSRVDIRSIMRRQRVELL